jgi:hypothetical protein
MSRNDEEWDKYTDEIRSIDSEELHETRPNRWTGPGSTWRKLTAEDRAVHAALEAVRHRDLALHLYNAFALKMGGHRCGPGDEVSFSHVKVRWRDTAANWGSGRR